MNIYLKLAAIVSTHLFSTIASAQAGDYALRSLAEAVLCKGNPAQAVYSLVKNGNNFHAGYAAYGFGEGTAYKAIVILKDPLKIGNAAAWAVISETDPSNYDFNAFTYAKFKGDYIKIVNTLNLKEINLPYFDAHSLTGTIVPRRVKMRSQARQMFSPEFKREAVRLLGRGDKEAAQLARELGIKRNQLYKWKEEIDAYGEEAFPGHGNRPRKAKADDSAALRAENKRLKEEIEILIKAAIYFAKESG